jgi:arylsulfatase A-like enzyme
LSLSRRHFFFGSFATAALAGKRPSRRPNILLVISDDLAAWMLGCYGNQDILTPNIDLLARGGMRFLNNFVVTPVCSASRATLFTGRLPRQHGIQDFLTPSPIEKPPQGQVAPPASFANEVMISDLLAGAGYRCGYVGKWHMGGDEKPGHGYGYTYTMGGGSSRYQDPVMYTNGERVQEKGYLADLITSRAGTFLDQQKPDQPFFLTVSHFNPHVPYDGHPAKYYQMYAKAGFEHIGFESPAPNVLREKEMLGDIVGNLRKCAAATTALDDQIPPLIHKLKQRGLLDNTLVVFTGNSGFLLGRHGLWSNGLASDPINMYEEVMQTPMIWNWPGRIPVEATRPELVSFVDVLPSLCQVADVKAPEGRRLPGRSYLPLALGSGFPKKQPWRNLVFGHFRNTEMARDPRFKLILREEGEGPNEFYDLRADPREKANQYGNAQYVTVRDQLADDIEAWRKKFV